MKQMSKVDRVSSWVLAFCFLLFVITGFDIQLRFLSPQISSLIHLKYLFLPAQLAFVLHSSFAIHLAMKRWNFWTAAGKSLLAVYAAINFYLIYLYFTIQFQ
jgi:cytochrome b subunit of formate dehydrogenase